MKAQVGTIIHFDGSRSLWQNWLGSHEITNYTWNLTVGGEELFFYTVEFDYAFAVAGAYRVYLTIMPELNGGGSSSVVITISDYAPVNLPPNAIIGGCVGWSIYYDDSWYGFSGYDSTDDLGIVSYNWSISGNGNLVQLSGPTISYSFGFAGEYQIELTVTDWGGLSDIDFLNLTVVEADDQPPIACAGSDQTVYVGEEVTFDASSSTDNVGIVEYLWLVFDGIPVTYHGAVVSHTFLSMGDFFVMLTVWDAQGGDDWDDLIVHVQGIPPEAEAGVDATIYSGMVFQFNASGSADDKPGLTFVWNFRYNKTDVVMFGESPSFRFDLPGKYVVTLTVTDTDGLFAHDSITVIVKEANGMSIPAWGLVFLGIAFVAAGAAVAVSVIAHNKHRKGRERSGPQSSKRP